MYYLMQTEETLHAYRFMCPWQLQTLQVENGWPKGHTPLTCYPLKRLNQEDNLITVPYGCLSLWERKELKDTWDTVWQTSFKAQDLLQCTDTQLQKNGGGEKWIFYKTIQLYTCSGYGYL